MSTKSIQESCILLSHIQFCSFHVSSVEHIAHIATCPSAALKNVASERLSCSHVSGICQKRLNVPAPLSMLRLCREAGGGGAVQKNIAYEIGLAMFMTFLTHV